MRLFLPRPEFFIILSIELEEQMLQLPLGLADTPSQFTLPDQSSFVLLLCRKTCVVVI